jgi:hypothetical protein
VLARGWSFIFVCKPESHKTLYEWVKGVTREYVEDRFDGKKHFLYRYNYVEGVPMRDKVKKDDKPLLVNFVSVTVTERVTGKQMYHNAFITNHPLVGETAQETESRLHSVIDCGRARWKIENENNNTLKTKGYHLEHNFGHGKTYLASVLATMNLLAFLFHTMLSFMDEKYRLLKTAIKARARFFDHIKILLIYHTFQSFASLMDFMLEGRKKPHDITKLTYPV